jgi:FkbM family methyltransferase
MHSQNSEERIILEFFSANTGTFLDIGANDGITFSNSYALVEKGWKGACVEASPKAFKRLKKLHKGKPVECTNVALAGYDGEITLHESGSLITENDIALVSSTMDSELTRWATMNMKFTEIKVPCVTFESFLKLSSYKTFDFISMDIEGMELTVLPQMDFDKLRTKLICVEWNGKDRQSFNKILHPFGFRVIHENQENLIYAKH